MKVKFTRERLTLVMILLGLGLGLFPTSPTLAAAEIAAELFVKLLKLISLPMVFLAVVSSGARMGGLGQMRGLGAAIIRYTFATTVIAATVALLLYLGIAPHKASQLPSVVAATTSGAELVPGAERGYWSFLRSAIPQSILEPFLAHNVMGVLFLALLIGAAMMGLPEAERRMLERLFASLFALVLKIAEYILYLMPLAVAAFVMLFVRDVRAGLQLESLVWYVACVVGANLIQAGVVLPLFLYSKGIAPRALARAMGPALTVAFFSKSSAAALPMAMRCAERAGISPAVSRFSFPLCSTVNMNACAAFILITVFYVSGLNGVEFGPLDGLSWIFIATIAAVGNAAVPMGCYFLASSFLAAQNVPLAVLGLILPIYTLIDMLETAINVWSDACVTAMVDREASELAAISTASGAQLPTSAALDR